MALPKNTVKGRFINTDGTPCSGFVVFKPRPVRLVDPTAAPPTTVVPAPVEVRLDANGSFNVELVTTDSPHATPTDWTYEVVFRITNRTLPSFDIHVPAGATVDLADVTPAAVQNGVQITRGPRGLIGPAGPPQSGRGVLCISWDDGWLDQFESIAPLADELGQRHTFYVNGALLNDGFNGEYDRMTMDQVVDLHTRGHEIGWHGATHASFTSLDVAGRAPEWDSSAVAAAIGAPVTSFAYPYGHADDTTNVESYLRYGSVALLTAGFAGATVYPLGEPMPHAHYRWDWGATADTLATALDLVRLCAQQPVAVHLYAHRPDVSANPSWEQVETLMRLAAYLGVPVHRVSDVFNGSPRLVNPGFESGLNGWLAGPVAGGTGTVVDHTPMPGLTGTKALKCVVPTAQAAYYVRQYVPVVPGRNYTLRARLRCEDGGSGGVRIGGRSLTGQVSAPAQGALYTGEEWGTAQHTWTCPNNVRWAQVDAIATGTAGTVYFDRLSFDETALGTYA